MTVSGVPLKKLDDYVVLGRYVIYVCIFAEILILPQVMSQFYMMYAGAAPRVTGCDSVSFDQFLNDTILCEQYLSMNCTKPQVSYQFRSVNVDFGYYCKETKIVKNTIAIQMVGVLLGSFVFGWLSDTFGRKNCMILSIVGLIIGWLTVALSKDLIQFTATRTIVGFFTGGGISVLNVFILENIPKHLRMWISMVITWAPNMPPMALLAWLFPKWDDYANANAAICVPSLIFLLLFIHESPRWLVAKGRVDEAREVIRRQLKASNQLHLMDDQFEEVLQNEHNFVMKTSAKQKQYSYIHLYTKSFKLALTTTVLAFSFTSTSIINYGILFNMEKVSGSIFLNSVYTGLIRYGCNLSFGFLDLKYDWIGRKFIHTSGLVVILLSLLLVIFGYYFELTNTLHTEIRIAILLASSMTSQVYIANGIVGSELFPTPIRNIGYSFLHVWNRVGVVLSPFVYLLQSYWIALPYCVMLIFSFVDVFLFETCLPETKGKPLIEHMPNKKGSLLARRRRAARPPHIDTLIDHSKLVDGIEV